MKLTKHAQLREQQRAISPIMSALLEEYGTEWQCFNDRFLQLLRKEAATIIEIDAKALIRELKRGIKVLKRVEKKASAKGANIQIVSEEGAIITEGNSERVKRRDY